MEAGGGRGSGEKTGGGEDEDKDKDKERREQEKEDEEEEVGLEFEMYISCCLGERAFDGGHCDAGDAMALCIRDGRGMEGGEGKTQGVEDAVVVVARVRRAPFRKRAGTAPRRNEARAWREERVMCGNW